MVDTLLQGQAVVADSPFLPLTWAYYDGVEHIGFDPDVAVNELKAAGYVLPPEGTIRAKDDVSLSFTMLYPDDDCTRNWPKRSNRIGRRLAWRLKLQAVNYDSL